MQADDVVQWANRLIFACTDNSPLCSAYCLSVGSGKIAAMGLFSWLGGLIDDLKAPGRAHTQRMHRAAGIGNVKLVCHRDTWQTLETFWGKSHSPQVPKDRFEPRDDDMVEVTLSGRNVVTLLNLTTNGYLVQTYEERAVADRVYEQIAKVIDAVDPEAQPGQPIPPIVLDDKLGNAPASS